jgi:hypothetical protein
MKWIFSTCIILLYFLHNTNKVDSACSTQGSGFPVQKTCSFQPEMCAVTDLIGFKTLEERVENENECCQFCINMKPSCSFFIFMQSDKVCLAFIGIKWSDINLVRVTGLTIGYPI